MPTFTLDDFLAELEEKTRREGAGWKLTAIGRIRTEDGLCPLQYVVGVPTPPALLGLLKVAVAHGMDADEADRVIDAADWSNHAGSLPLRLRLLKATGLA